MIICQKCNQPYCEYKDKIELIDNHFYCENCAVKVKVNKLLNNNEIGIR